MKFNLRRIQDRKKGDSYVEKILGKGHLPLAPPPPRYAYGGREVADDVQQPGRQIPPSTDDCERPAHGFITEEGRLYVDSYRP